MTPAKPWLAVSVQETESLPTEESLGDTSHRSLTKASVSGDLEQVVISMVTADELGGGIYDLANPKNWSPNGDAPQCVRLSRPHLHSSAGLTGGAGADPRRLWGRPCVRPLLPDRPLPRLGLWRRGRDVGYRIRAGELASWPHVAAGGLGNGTIVQSNSGIRLLDTSTFGLFEPESHT